MDLIKKIGAVGVALALFVGVATAVSPVAKATGQHANLQASMVISTDDGRTWQSGEPSVCVRPGSEILVMYKIWNEGDLEVKSVRGYSTTTNGEYITENTVDNADQDGDGHSFVFDNNSADFTIANLTPNSSADEGYQGIITTATFSNETPCDTPIRGEVVLTRFETPSPSADPDLERLLQVNSIVGRALAATNVMNTVSSFTVNINRDTCPKTCGSSTPTATVTTLPQTGSDVLDLVQSLF